MAYTERSEDAKTSKLALKQGYKMAYEHSLFDHEQCDWNPCEWHIANTEGAE